MPEVNRKKSTIFSIYRVRSQNGPRLNMFLLQRLPLGTNIREWTIALNLGIDLALQVHLDCVELFNSMRIIACASLT